MWPPTTSKTTQVGSGGHLYHQDPRVDGAGTTAVIVVQWSILQAHNDYSRCRSHSILRASARAGGDAVVADHCATCPGWQHHVTLVVFAHGLLTLEQLEEAA
jgi:hypothetical protein